MRVETVRPGVLLIATTAVTLSSLLMVKRPEGRRLMETVGGLPFFSLNEVETKYSSEEKMVFTRQLISYMPGFSSLLEGITYSWKRDGARASSVLTSSYVDAQIMDFNLAPWKSNFTARSSLGPQSLALRERVGTGSSRGPCMMTRAKARETWFEGSLTVDLIATRLPGSSVLSISGMMENSEGLVQRHSGWVPKNAVPAMVVMTRVQLQGIPATHPAMLVAEEKVKIDCVTSALMRASVHVGGRT
mmetsp:Transcript_21141/g.49545  ORF Transcript_21141/g.49545 Transcript_21141/m.49545 type:complete len:246 (-) Transcript_21141:10322-11059(-)